MRGAPGEAGGERSPAFVGVVPVGSGRASIGGAPLPLLRTEEGTFLERALTLLRDAGASALLVVLEDDRGPVAAEARRHGAEVRSPASLAEEGPGLAGGDGPAFHSVPLLFLSPGHVLLRPETLARLLGAASGTPGEGALLVPHRDGLEEAEEGWPRRSPLLLPGEQGTGAQEAGAQEAGAQGAGGEEGGPAPKAESRPEAPEENAVQGVLQGLMGGARPPLSAPVLPMPAPVFPVPVPDDPGIALSVDTLTLYRRHFPRVFRKRFQKW